MIPQIEALEINNLEIISLPSRTYRVGENKIEGFIDNIQAIQQTVWHILSTERYAYVIYPDNYGVELEQYFGQSYEYIEANIGNTIQEALLQDDRISEVIINSIEQGELDIVLINFTVVSTLGTFSQDWSVNTSG